MGEGGGAPGISPVPVPVPVPVAEERNYIPVPSLPPRAGPAAHPTSFASPIRGPRGRTPARPLSLAMVDTRRSSAAKRRGPSEDSSPPPPQPPTQAEAAAAAASPTTAGAPADSASTPPSPQSRSRSAKRAKVAVRRDSFLRSGSRLLVRIHD